MGEKGMHFVSPDTDEAPVQLGPDTGVQVLERNAVHDEDDEWVPGAEAGTVWFEKTTYPGDPDVYRVSANFRFTNPAGQVYAKGLVHRVENDDFKGKLPATGSGAFREWKGQVEVHIRNPKRWIFDPGLGSGS